MLKQDLIEGFNRSTCGKNEKDGERVFKNDLISDLNYEGDKDKIVLTSSVISEDLYSQYSCKLDIDKRNSEVIFSHCSCNTFEKKNSKRGYCCKHLVATFYKFINSLDEDPSIKDELGLTDAKENIVKKTESSILDLLLGEEKKKDKIKIEVILNKIQWTGKLGAEFKIGLEGMKSNKLYTLKDIDAFLVALYNRISIPYGKDYIFNIKEQRLTSSTKRLISFIELLKEIDLSSNSFRKVNEKLVSGKQITIPKALLREFMTIIKDFRVYLGNGFYSRLIETEVLEENIPLPMNLKDLGNLIKLEAPRGIPEALNDSNDVFMFNTTIYLPSYDQIESITPYLEAFNHGNSIFFTRDEEERVLRDLIPSMQKVSHDIELSKSLSNKVVIAPVSFKFYFDKSDDIFLTLKVCYDKYEFNYFHNLKDKVIYRDSNKEEKVIRKLRELGFEEVNETFRFFKDDEYIFKFFKEDILELHEYGEIFYSDRFTGIKNLSSNSFKGEVRKGKYDYFEFKFKLGDIKEDETTNILRAFRDSKKFYKLSSGEFLDLEEIELNKLLKLLDSLNEDKEISENTIEFNKNKGMYVEDYLQDNEITYVKGRRGLKSLKTTLGKLKGKEFPIPECINANLREYQKIGYSWLKTLDYLGFGGILGDEMGLGKTLQTITFLSSNEKALSLIVAPTSLVYNWYKEFKKFAPTMKVGILHSNREEREDILKNREKYDVLITTYNLIKRDVDLYKEIEFDYCILDEAQNIKNPSSQNAKSVKSIKSKNRFALTGTPIENSLMELWSIFDFIMPGYLYDEKKFATRYHRRLEEDECLIKDLNRLIKPFILRRYKRDVIKELPDKIENKLIVPLDDEQLKVYSTYVKYIQDIIEKKVENDEFAKSKIEILSYITKLRQICLDPSVVMDDYKGGSGKIDALLETVSQSIDEGHKILVFSQFTSVLNNISKAFRENEITYCYLDGSTPIKKRNKLVEDFNNDDTSVFLISLKAGGTGLNLTSADIVIHFDPWWNPAVEDQATDRAHRIGQKHVVEVIKMISEGTIEEKIISLQEEKKSLIDKVVGKDIKLGDNISNLDEEDILSLFKR
ncbi:MAG: SNF2 helicase associated domain-containing protein [Clostridium sp.]|uniref:DEAD/DEAH box helicase n=1 Tax=Clostridium TaxID=1485 RepID=UPI000DCFC57F|nr:MULTISPECIES: SNF2 helicase associated domain-containing protein [Clostridium]MDU3323164.1 SNF2 helicase associated domain-containing protein [Escherichia coli]MDU3410369.1 SNF2 helicase associated domain-containing protein [Clostridium sp.]MDU4787239.1 SNF2 helicase associated domain-containing protein [Clostridium sp.]MDU6809724.1 SNF2 helicase associated domain-containing protein [Clostridium sp.]